MPSKKNIIVVGGAQTDSGSTGKPQTLMEKGGQLVDHMRGMCYLATFSTKAICQVPFEDQGFYQSANP